MDHEKITSDGEGTGAGEARGWPGPVYLATVVGHWHVRRGLQWKPFITPEDVLAWSSQHSEPERKMSLKSLLLKK